MHTVTGTHNKVLLVNVTAKSFSVLAISEADRKNYLGGKGLGLKLLYDLMPAKVDPLGEANIIAFMMGVLMGSGAPCSGRFDAVTKSPLTGIMTSSSCGGPFGMALKTSGWEGVLIQGKADKPIYLTVDSNGVEFIDTSRLWGSDTKQTQERLANHSAGALVIGPAGENIVHYANICSGHRFLGRGGMGAVLGAKKVKAIVAKGNEYRIVPADMKKFGRARTKALKYINRNSITSAAYRTFGTNANVNLNNAGGILPVRNFTGGSHVDAYKISGETFADSYSTGYATCKPCAILCGHKGVFAKHEQSVPEYETTGMFGANLEIFDPIKIAEWNEVCGLLGMDTISAAGTLAWAMEAAEKKLFASSLRFGSAAGITEVLHDIAFRRGIGADLALGSRYCAAKYGGTEFAMQVKGLELPAYDPRGSFGQGLSYAVANRGGCHLASSVFAIEVYFNLIQPLTHRSKAALVAFNENVFSAVNSLHICQFTAFPFELEPFIVKHTPKKILNLFMTLKAGLAVRFMDLSLWPELWSGVTGVPLFSRSFLKAGARIQTLERYMNTLEGISRQDDTLPQRLLIESRGCDPQKHTVPLEKMLDAYYRARGYDIKGIPTDKTLKKYGIVKKQ